MMSIFSATRRSAWIRVLAAFLLAMSVAACGGGDAGDGGGGSAPSASTGPTAPGTSPETSPPPKTTPVPVVIAVVIQPSQLDSPPEFQVQARAIAQFDDGSTQDVTEQAYWRSGDEALVAVGDSSGSKGALTALKSGKVTITAQYAGFTGSVAVNVVPTRLIGYDGLVFQHTKSLLTVPSVAMDGLGRAHATWGYQASGEVFYGGHDGTDWTDRVQINENQTPADFVFALRILTNAAGARLILWHGFSGIYAVHAAPGQPFGPVQTVVPELENLVFREISGAHLTSSGDAVLIWTGQNTTFVSRYSAATGSWAPPVALSSGSNLLPYARTAFNAAGDAVVAWSNYNEATFEATLRAGVLLNDGSGTVLSDVRELLTFHAHSMTYIAGAINEKRDAVLVWAHHGPGITPGVSQYSPASGWHSPQALPLGTAEKVTYPRVAINRSNHVVVAWADTLGQRPYATRFTPLDGWQTPQALSTDIGLGSSTINALALADNGNAICIFVGAATLAGKQFQYRRFGVGQGWGAPSVLPDPGLVGNPNQSLWVAYNDNGQGVMAWQEAGDIPIDPVTLMSVWYNFMELAPGIHQ
jgi:hypothetical protein